MSARIGSTSIPIWVAVGGGVVVLGAAAAVAVPRLMAEPEPTPTAEQSSAAQTTPTPTAEEPTTPAPEPDYSHGIVESWSLDASDLEEFVLEPGEVVFGFREGALWQSPRGSSPEVVIVDAFAGVPPTTDMPYEIAAGIDASTGTVLWDMTALSLSDCAFAPDGATVACAEVNFFAGPPGATEVFLLDAITGEREMVASLPEQAYPHLMWEGDDLVVATNVGDRSQVDRIAGDGSILWSTVTGDFPSNVSGVTSELGYAVVWHEDGTMNTVRLETGEEVLTEDVLFSYDVETSLGPVTVSTDARGGASPEVWRVALSDGEVLFEVDEVQGVLPRTLVAGDEEYLILETDTASTAVTLDGEVAATWQSAGTDVVVQDALFEVSEDRTRLSWRDPATGEVGWTREFAGEVVQMSGSGLYLWERDEHGAFVRLVALGPALEGEAVLGTEPAPSSSPTEEVSVQETVATIQRALEAGDLAPIEHLLAPSVTQQWTLEQLQAQLLDEGEVEITESEDTATYRITTGGGAYFVQAGFERVDGHWVLTTLGNNMG
ncbi:PQQ-binding-like beta-propeller repeat protein [Serinibacter salmoneus]|uniref:Putative pyrroloquinoline-quinone binding quinoprotein n=1 Tax=Serinibacter salmoneus TaxID=556530 RepID=A0A2A9D628_9MICO|nr:PQQ-binding-like beta-propeller repeat protein [Serinibacter salmoneus]PFG21299.1 putative pyrroloquinoline-quinone binding quinoprotein [Serinibacter salmoneus]